MDLMGSTRERSCVTADLLCIYSQIIMIVSLTIIAKVLVRVMIKQD